MNGLFELDSKWKNIIDYDNTFLKEYETRGNESSDKQVVAFLNDVCESLGQDYNNNKFVDPKPYIRLLENCSKEISKKLANNSLDSYKYKNEQITEYEKNFNQLVVTNLEPGLQDLKGDFDLIEKKLNKILTNNKTNNGNQDLNKGLLSLIQNLRLRLGKNNKHLSNIKLLQHYEYFYQLVQKHNCNNEDEIEEVFDLHVLPLYKFEITELDSEQIERQAPVNKAMSVVLTRLSKLATKLDKNNNGANKDIEKISKLIYFTKSQFEKCIMDDFTLLYENLYNNSDGEHDEACIYECLNLIIFLWNNMKTAGDSLIDIFVDMHPFLKKLHLEDEKSFSLYSSILSNEKGTVEVSLSEDFHDAKFELFVNQILSVINKEIDIIGKIFTDQTLFLETCNKFIKKIMITKVKPVCEMIISYGINNLQAIQYCKIIQSLFNFLYENISPITNVFEFVDEDIETFIKKELFLNFDKKQFQLYLNKSLNLLANKLLKNIHSQQIPPSSLNDLKNLLKKNEQKNYMSILKEVNKSSNIGKSDITEDNATKLLNSFGQRTLTQFNSLLKHAETNGDDSLMSPTESYSNNSVISSFKAQSPSPSVAKVTLDIDRFSIYGLLENVVYLFAVQKDVLSSSLDDWEMSKQQILATLNNIVDNYFIRNLEIFYYFNKSNLLSGIDSLFQIMAKQESQIRLYFKCVIDLFGFREDLIDYSLLNKIENIINILYIKVVLEFNDVITKALKLQNKKDYVINNNNRKKLVNDAESTEAFKIIINTTSKILAQFDESTNAKSFLEIVLNNLYKMLLNNYKKFEVNPAGGLIMNSDIVNLYNTIEQYQLTIVSPTTLDEFKLLKELVAVFTMNDLNSVRYLVENSIYLKKNVGLHINEYIKKRV